MSPRTTIKTGIDEPITALAVQAFLNTVETESKNNKFLGNGYIAGNSDVRSATQLLIMPLCAANQGRVQKLGGEGKATKKVLEALPNHKSLFGAYREIINPQKSSCPTLTELHDSINEVLQSSQYAWAGSSDKAFHDTATKAIAAAHEVMGTTTDKLTDIDTARAKRNEGCEL